MGFAERYGHVKEKSIQLNNIDTRLRARLCNFTKMQFENMNFEAYRDILNHIGLEYFIVDVDESLNMKN